MYRILDEFGVVNYDFQGSWNADSQFHLLLGVIISDKECAYMQRQVHYDRITLGRLTLLTILLAKTHKDYGKVSFPTTVHLKMRLYYERKFLRVVILA